MIYDPLETEASKKILLELIDELQPSESFGLVGGWAVHSLVGEEFLKATGREFPMSRDIDVFIDCEGSFPREFARAIGKVGFTPREYKFRYTLILDRNSMDKLSEREARGRQAFELIYVYLDVLGNKESSKLGVWPNEIVGRIIGEKATKVITIGGRQVPVPRGDLLLLLKTEAFLQRETREKKMKDACDIYGLLFYSSTRIKLSRGEPWKVELLRRGVGGMLEEEILDFIAAELFGDRLKSGLVKRGLDQLLATLPGFVYYD
ncbi:MAG: hypothetical protein AB1476_00860 [Candidatus Hadarchaeota archaeon]